MSLSRAPRASTSSLRPTPSGASHARDGAGRGDLVRGALRGMSLAEQERTLAPVQRRGEGRGGADVQAVASAGVRGASGALPHLEAIQASFGRHDVSHARAQIGGSAAEASRSIGASAYATGDRVGFAAPPSLHTAAHEAAHVVQQRAGVSLLGGVGRAGDAYERHADQVADLVVQGKSAEPLLDAFAGRGGGSAAVQREQCGPLADGFVPCSESSDFALDFSGGASDAAAPKEDAQEYVEVPHYIWQENGETIQVPVSRYGAACNERIEGLRRDAIADMKSKAKEARILHNHFKAINKQHRVSAWFSEALGGVEMPQTSVIFNAELAAERAERAAKKGGGAKALRKTLEAIEQGEETINKAINAMRTYHEGVIKGASFGIGALKVTAAVSFTIAGACAAATLAPVLVAKAGMTVGAAKVASGTIAAAGTAGVSNTAKQTSEIAHGMREDFDGKELLAVMAKEGALAVVSGPIAGRIAGRVAGPLASALSEQLGRKITEKAVAQVLTGSFNRAFRGVLSDTLTAVVDPDKMTMKAFLKNLATNLIAGGIAGHFTSKASDFKGGAELNALAGG